MAEIDCEGRGRGRWTWGGGMRSRRQECVSATTRRGGEDAPAALCINASTRGGALWIALHGELDIATAPVLALQLKGAIARRHTLIVLDLRGLEFIDSAGLHALIDAGRRARETHSELRLTRGSRSVERLLSLTSCTALLRFLD